MIVTMTDPDEQPLEPLMVFCIDREKQTFSLRFMDSLTREQVEAMAKQLPRMMARAVAMHPRLM